MFEINKPNKKPIVVIRAATASELSNYEKRKLAAIEENAQENKIESISVNVDGNIQQIKPLNKDVTIELGKLANKSSITPADISSDDLFFIKCELDKTAFYEQN